MHTIASEFKDAKTFTTLYPGERPSESYALIEKDLTYVCPFKDVDMQNLGESKIILQNEVKISDYIKNIENRIPTIAYGSNVCPATLINKFNSFGISADSILIKGYMENHRSAFMTRFSPAGSSAAKMVKDNGSSTEAWLLLLNEEQMELMNKSEKVNLGVYGIALKKITIGNKSFDSYAYVGGETPIYAPDNKKIIFAGSEYRGNGDLVPNKDFIPIDSDVPNSTQMAHIEILKIYHKLLGNDSPIIFNGEKLKIIKEKWEKANKILSESDFALHIKEDINDIENFKRLKDIL